MEGLAAALSAWGSSAVAALSSLELPQLQPLLPPLLAGAIGAAATAPAFSACALAVWKWLDLPESDGNVAEITRRLRHAGYASLALHCLCALFSGAIVRFLLLVYSLAGATPLAFASLPLGAKRMWTNLYEALPIVWHYIASEKWAKEVHLEKERFAKHRGELDERYAPQVSALMMKQGGLYVKLGQLLSIFPEGIIAEAYMAEFRKMQTEVAAMQMEQVREVLERAYGRPMEEVFSNFEERPLGAASIGQVHRANLADDGREVAVKVQRPDSSAGAWADFWTLKLIARFCIPDLIPFARHFKDWIERELDFEVEASVLARVHESLRGSFTKINVPKPVEELCRKEVVVMSFVPGVSLLQALVHMATIVLGEKGKKALAGLLSDELEPEEDTGAALRAVQGSLACGALGASLGTVVLAWRRRRALLRAFRRGLLASGAVAVLAAVAHRAMRGPQPSALVLRDVLPSRATVVRLIQHGMASARSATNLGIAVYNRLAGLAGARRLRYKKEIPKFDPVGVAFELWKVQGHQVFVDGLFNTDAHPGNFLIDQPTGSISLIDFGQACELPLRLRVLFARQVIALVDGDDREIAIRHAHMGYVSERMTVVVLAASARLKFGQLTSRTLEGTLKNFDRLKKWDPVTDPNTSETMLLERMISLLRGTTAVLGAPLDECCPSQCWLGLSRALLEKHGGEVEEPHFELSDEIPQQPKGYEIG